MISRGDLYLVDMTHNIGSSQQGIRPAVIIQNDMGNKFSPTTIVAPITSRQKKEMPTHVQLLEEDGVRRASTVLCEQPMVIDKSLLVKQLGKINDKKILEINQKLAVSMGIV